MLLRRVVRRCARPSAADALLSRTLSTLSLCVDGGAADRPAWPSASGPPPPSIGRTVAALASASGRRRRHPKKPAPARPQARPHRLRVADERVTALLSAKTPPDAFARACEALADADEVALLAGTDPRAWSVALQRRLARGDEAGARALLDLAAGFARENTTESLWTDLLFAVLRDPRPGGMLRSEDTLVRMLDGLSALHGRRFVADVVVAAANGCGKVAMFDAARLLVRYHLDRLQAEEDGDAEDEAAPPIPASIVGNLASCMADRRQFADAIAFVERELLAHARFDPCRDFQQQGFLALFRSYAASRTAPEVGVDRFLCWARRLADEKGEEEVRNQRLEKGFGAAIQCCVATGRPSLALRCFDALRALNDRFSGQVDDAEDAEDYIQLKEVAPPDENVFVNVLKASAALQDGGLFRDVYREMAARGVARSAGFGSAIRFCHVHQDAAFLEQVLEDAFACEAALQGEWLLPIEQYNDALGCLAEADAYEQARELFETRLLGNPFVAPDHITMVELVESYRGASLSELFRLMEVFLEEFGLAPNTQVYTSLLAACARQRLAGDATALLASMRAHRVPPDVKTFTTVAFIYGAQGDHAGVVDLVRAMHDEGLAPDQKFFDYALNALYEASGIDVCFALLGEVCAAGFPVPHGLYHALIELGTARGLVERTLHVAYNMECDGFALSSAQMRALVARSVSDAEVAQLARTFLLLHDEFLRGPDGADSSASSSSSTGGDDGARFDADVYDAMVALLTRFSKKDALAKVRALADRAGVRLSEHLDADDALEQAVTENK